MRAVRREQILAMEGLLDGYFQVESAQDRNGILRSILTRAEYYKEERNTKGIWRTIILRYTFSRGFFLIANDLYHAHSYTSIWSHIMMIYGCTL